MNIELLNELTEWRHYLHQYPETAFEEVNTARFVAEKLREMGYDVATSVGKTGVVGSLKVGNSEKVIGIRAEMDALNIHEENDLPYRSTIDGKMHACGHDGHVSAALGAAKLLSENKDFNGTVRFVFQPAEEHGEGAMAMIKDGLFERFPMNEIYGLHNMPQLSEGEVHSKVGPIMASEDNFRIHIKGRGGHASAPNVCIDPMVIAAQIILALQTIVSRSVNPVDTAVVSVTEIHTDGIINAIPSNVIITGDTRSYTPEVQKLIGTRMETLVQKICEAYEADYEFSYTNSFKPTINWEECHLAVVEAAVKVLGKDKVNSETQPMMSSEDFAHFITDTPGCFFFLGGKREDEQVYALHNANFDYKDENLIRGAELFAEIVKSRLK